MRYFGAVRGTGRFASEDIEYRDVLFPAGTFIAPSMADGQPRPSGVRPTRARSTSPASRAGQPQLTFGSGIHYCLGAALARAELQEALPLLARRMPDLRLDGEVTWKPNSVGIFGPEHLPVTFTRSLTSAPASPPAPAHGRARLPCSAVPQGSASPERIQATRSVVGGRSLALRLGLGALFLGLDPAVDRALRRARQAPWSIDVQRLTQALGRGAPRRSSGSGAGCARRRRRS